MNDNNNRKKIRTTKMILPVIPLRGMVVFPYMVIHFDVGRPRSIKALEESMLNEQNIFLVAQKDAGLDNPEYEDLYDFGAICKVKQLLKLPNGNIRVLVEGIAKGELFGLVDNKDYLTALVKRYPNSKIIKTDELEALKRAVKEVLDEYMQINAKAPNDVALSVLSIDNPDELADIVGCNVLVNVEHKMEILSETDVKTKLIKLIKILNDEKEILALENDINNKVRAEIDKSQREHYLREQAKVIQNELDESEGVLGEEEEYNKRILDLKLPKASEEKLLKDVTRMKKMHPMSQDGSLLRSYLDTVLELPWNISTPDNFELLDVEEKLNKDHYGLEDVKERILEFLAVKKLSNNLKSPVLCLVGPPGIGKTSIARSIADAMGRKFARISLGGIRDEAEIRGHRKTYIGAMPGRIISAIKTAGSENAFILLDEIDKLGNDYRGDPSSALLEVLDGEQNNTFTDHFIEIPFDLSKVMFVTTANSLETVSRPLLDRMEVIELTSYTEPEKAEIAINHLIPKMREQHGLTKSTFSINRDAVLDVINYYVRESGVRNLERKIAEICRKSAKLIVENKKKKVVVTSKNLPEFLGKHKFINDKIFDEAQIGVVTGLAWTQVGGDTLFVEANVMEGTGKIELTGSLGDVMKESAMAGISYIRSKADALGIKADFYKTKDIHIHVPEGATPKDGPSAGITIATALISALTKRPVKNDVAMTGEITLRGRVLPIGGLKEKCIAAHTAGIKTIIIPKENQKDIEEIPENVRNDLKFITATSMETVVSNALLLTKEMKTYEYFGDVFNYNEKDGIRHEFK